MGEQLLPLHVLQVAFAQHWSMSTISAQIEQEFKDFWYNREWKRYVQGSLIHDLTDIKRTNDVSSWIRQSVNDWNIHEIEEYITKLKQVLYFIDEERIEKNSSEWVEKSNQVANVVKNAISMLNSKWTSFAYNMCGAADNRNDYVFQNANGMLFFWRISFERRNKFIFFPGIQIEVTPFLETLMIKREHYECISGVEETLKKYGPGYLFNGPFYNDDLNGNDTEGSATPPNIPLLAVEEKKNKKKKEKKDDKNTLAKNIDQLVKQSKEARKSRRQTIQVPKSRSPSRSPARRPSVKPSKSSSNSPKLLLAESDKKQKEANSEHLVNFRNENFLGPVFRISLLAAGKKPKQCGAWIMHTEVDLQEETLNGRNLNIALKVPVEEVFIAPSEPVVAFCEDGSSEWKKGVYSTHSQFDQNTFVLNTRLSKLGRVALFQANDFHFPYRKWSIHFSKESISYKLHTHSVEIKFVVEGNVLYLETQTGDEFSKLRSLHQRKMSIAEMSRQLIRHGVYIFPDEDILTKQKDTYKNISLEIQLYRIICADQLSCQHNRLNATVPKDTAFITHSGTTLHLTEKSGGGYSISYHGELTKENNESKCGLSTLFRWLMLTRPLPLTK